MSARLRVVTSAAASRARSGAKLQRYVMHAHADKRLFNGRWINSHSSLQVAHFLAADASPWASRLCSIAADLNPWRTPVDIGALAPPVQAALRARARRATHRSAGNAMPLLAPHSADMQAAVLAAHPVLTGMQPLGRCLACLPQQLHSDALRAAVAACSGGNADDAGRLVLDVTEPDTMAAVAQGCDARSIVLQAVTLVEPQAGAHFDAAETFCASASTAHFLALPTVHASLGELRIEGLRCAMDQVDIDTFERLTCLRSLQLVGGAMLATMLVTLLGACSSLRHLTRLALLDVALQPEDAAVPLSDISLLSTLQYLDLSGTASRCIEADTFCSLPRLKHCGLANTIRDSAAGRGPLPQLICGDALTHLDLTGAPIDTDATAVAVANALSRKSSLVHLCLRNTGLTTRGASAIAGALTALVALTGLDVSHNTIGDTGAQAIARVIARLPLQSIDFKFTGGTEPAGGPLLAAGAQLPSMRHIGLSRAQVSDQTRQRLAQPVRLPAACVCKMLDVVVCLQCLCCVFCNVGQRIMTPKRYFRWHCRGYCCSWSWGSILSVQAEGNGQTETLRSQSCSRKRQHNIAKYFTPC